MSTNGPEEDVADANTGPEEKPTWLIPALVGVALVAALVAAQFVGGDSEPGPETVPEPVPDTSTSLPSATDVPPTTDVTDTTDTTDTPATTEAPPTTEPGDPDAATRPALAVTGADLVWLDTGDGGIEVLHESLFEAQYPVRLALAPGVGRAYYQLFYEDYWFSCETAFGQVMVLDVASGASTEIGRGIPALSPDGSRLAYLTSEDCFPDPDADEFFVAVFDTVVIADANGPALARDTLVRYRLEGPVGTAGSEALVNLVWADDAKLLVLNEAGVTHELPATVDSPQPISSYPTRDLPGLYLLGVVGGYGVGSAVDPTGSGPLTRVDLVSGEAAPIPDVPQGASYAVGVSEDGELIVGVDGTVLVDLDLFTGESAGIFDLASVAAIDW